MPFARHAAGLLVALLALFPAQDTPPQDSWRAEVEVHRQKRNTYLRSDPFSPLALVHREYLEGRTRLTIGSGTDTDFRLLGEGIALLHATVEVEAGAARVRVEPGAASMSLIGEVKDEKTGGPVHFMMRSRGHDLTKFKGFVLGHYNLLYRADAPVRGAALEVYDTAEPAITGFKGLDYFDIDARYRVQAELTPRAEPPQVQLIDSAGQPRPYYVYGDLRFQVEGVNLTMEVYSITHDRAAIARSGFMLIFADATSGKESYYAGRYLDIEGKLSGAVTVDFNLARNPPCAFSPVFTCPFPRTQNRLPWAIRAGEKSYRGKTATPLKK